ncbi:MAG: GAF domain-containing protein [Verrucomicrobiota bacterium]
MAAQLAIALGKFRAEEELKQSHDRLEITVQERTEELQKANRALMVLTECDEALLRATTEMDLLNQICNLMVKIDNVSMVWVGFAEQDEGKTVRPVTQSGGDKEYLKKASVSWADTPRGNGPVGRSIRTRQVVQCWNIATDPCFEPWREDAMQRGYAAMIALPLLWKEQCLGSLGIYSSQAGGFNEEATELLMRLAGDLTFGIIALRARAAHEKLQRE